VSRAVDIETGTNQPMQRKVVISWKSRIILGQKAAGYRGQQVPFTNEAKVGGSTDTVKEGSNLGYCGLGGGGRRTRPVKHLQTLDEGA